MVLNQLSVTATRFARACPEIKYGRRKRAVANIPEDFLIRSGRKAKVHRIPGQGERADELLISRRLRQGSPCCFIELRRCLAFFVACSFLRTADFEGLKPSIKDV
jgi:hypothetical protein